MKRVAPATLFASITIGYLNVRKYNRI